MALAGCTGTSGVAPIQERARGATPITVSRPLPAVAPGYYRVLPGDTLYKIAFEFGQYTPDLAAWNQLADPGRIRSGDILRVIPPRPGVVVQALPQPPAVEGRRLAETPTVVTRPLPAVPDVAGRALPARSSLPAVTPAAPPEPELADDAPPDRWAWPLHGPILARFGDGMNKGIEIAGPRGRTVQAAAPGRVVYAGTGLRGYGKLIIIRHGKTLLSAYAHHERILVSEGQYVTRGQAVGEVGDSDADRVKLHFEIRERGKPVDPLNYLPNAG